MTRLSEPPVTNTAATVGQATDDSVCAECYVMVLRHGCVREERIATLTSPWASYSSASGFAFVGFRCGARALAPPRQPPGVLPISSTPLPFQRNFTVLSRPSIPPEYFRTTVSPVLCEVSIPLNPNVSGTPVGMYLP